MSAELASVRDGFLAAARERGDGGTEFTVVVGEPPGEAGGGESEERRGWRFDARTAFAGRSFLLTPDGGWYSAVRTGPSSFGWGLLEGEELELALDEWSDELIRQLTT
jgi:hypothetical protein